ncbi:hypothetical protein O181_048001 [Austropuccinia psidii MF-1]|uniref:Uncharacterized protein n=1 Tax=Austropuccinia psidii MF-1 TaxID=1389203 RepID=A0A9Q3HK00_9BASI|nr:hypothetical protein [Austropuccinia psidii MF-1]
MYCTVLYQISNASFIILVQKVTSTCLAAERQCHNGDAKGRRCVSREGDDGLWGGTLSHGTASAAVACATSHGAPWDRVLEGSSQNIMASKPHEHNPQWFALVCFGQTSPSWQSANQSDACGSTST